MEAGGGVASGVATALGLALALALALLPAEADAAELEVDPGDVPRLTPGADVAGAVGRGVDVPPPLLLAGADVGGGVDGGGGGGVVGGGVEVGVGLYGE